jgi:DNA-binding response OmpR family regulator
VKRILVVDDDPAMRDVICEYLERHDFEVRPAASGAAMTRILATEEIDLVILDLKLGQEDGMDLMRGLRTSSDAPVILITGHRLEEMDRVIGLELGADDYLTKPLALRELVARVRTVLRRLESAGERARRRESRARYRFAGWELDIARRRLTSPAGAEVSLTSGEFNLLTAFVRSPQRVMTREQLLVTSRVHDAEVFDRSVDVLVLRLRRKLEVNPSDPALIRTERGIGYVFAPAVESL